MTVKTPSVLAFERRLDISDAYLWQSNSQDKAQPLRIVSVQEKSVRGTIGNRLKNATASDPTKQNAKIESANLQHIDVSSLDADCDTLVVKFSCKVLPFDGTPNVCNEPNYQQAVLDLVAEYKKTHQFAELAKRYAINIANARFLWRNRLGAEHVEVCVSLGKESIIFKDAKAIKLNDFKQDSPELAKLSQWIQQGLLGEAFVILDITATAKVGYAQEVYPSQELVLDAGNKKSKVLYQTGSAGNHAAMHSQKVSNAIRTIDDWYPDAKFPIAIEPYGAVTTLGTAFRQPKQKQDFYSLFDGWILKGKTPTSDEQHYVMGVLIRGGVFGEGGKDA